MEVIIAVQFFLHVRFICIKGVSIVLCAVHDCYTSIGKLYWFMIAGK